MFSRTEIFKKKSKSWIRFVWLCNKSRIIKATRVDTSAFIKKVDLANLKSNTDKLDIDKLKNIPINSSNLKSKIDKLDVDKLFPVPFDLIKLSDVVKTDLV